MRQTKKHYFLTCRPEHAVGEREFTVDSRDIVAIFTNATK